MKTFSFLLLLLTTLHFSSQVVTLAPTYDVKGVFSVDVYETSVFYWKGRYVVQENMVCYSADHYGHWNETFKDHSYVRLRDFLTGELIVNITNTIDFAFVSAFPDYTTDTAWLVGFPSNRCKGWIINATASVQVWWSKDLVNWQTSKAFQFNKEIGPNVEVSIVPNPPKGLPPHRYVMMIECFNFAINNNADGNLTHGWEYIPGATFPPGAPCGGPSLRFNPMDQYYYIITGGNVIDLYRTQDFVKWEASPYNPMVKPTPADAQVANFADFPNNAVRQAFVPLMRDNWEDWDWNSNDADVCCQHPDVKEAYIVWGASTQGQKPKPPVTTAGCTNAVGIAKMTLNELLSSFFS